VTYFSVSKVETYFYFWGILCTNMPLTFSISSRSLSFSVLLLFLSVCSARGQSKTEAEHVQKIIQSLKAQDSMAYAAVFPSADTMLRVTLRKAPPSSDEYQRSRYLLESPEMIVYQDSMIMKQAGALYNPVVERGKKIGIHWEDIQMSRFELEALAKTKDAALEAIVSERFVGYLFIEDMQTRKIFTLSLSEIMKIDGKWYGGELNYVFEANNKDAFNALVLAEKIRLRKGLPDTTAVAEDSTSVKDEDDQPLQRKQIADRKLYTGFLDDEIPVSLYIRYIKGDCPETVCSWEAIFKFGDNEYVRQSVSKTADGKFNFVEEETGGVLDVELKGAILSGVFSATIDKVDYDAELKEKTMSKKKLESLDAIIERDLTR